jgi:DNA modification methylase
MFHPDTPLEYRNAIVTGDARELARRIPDESVDLIFTDPIYWEVEDYGWLAGLAARVLRDGGSVVAQAGIEYRFEAETAMRQIEGLTPRPLLAEVFPGATFQMWKHRTFAGWKPYIWLTKGRNLRWVFDRFHGGGTNKGHHQWQDSERFYVEYIHRFTDEGGIVLEPFTGSGTTPAVCSYLRRNYIAFEIDPVTAERARERVQNTQPPLFVPEPEQMELLCEREQQALAGR